MDKINTLRPTKKHPLFNPSSKYTIKSELLVPRSPKHTIKYELLVSPSPKYTIKYELLLSDGGWEGGWNRGCRG